MSLVPFQRNRRRYRKMDLGSLDLGGLAKPRPIIAVEGNINHSRGRTDPPLFKNFLPQTLCQKGPPGSNAHKDQVIQLRMSCKQLITNLIEGDLDLPLCQDDLFQNHCL